MVSQPHHPRLRNKRLSSHDSISLLYHDIFNHPLKEFELDKWFPGKNLKLRSARPKAGFFDGYFVLSGKAGLVKERIMKENASRKKIRTVSIAKQVLLKHKNILLVAITGSLAMAAAGEDADIDLLIVTKKGRLWTTRFMVLFSLLRRKVLVRRAGAEQEKDRLCLNIWLDEKDLVIRERNPYTAHEIAQILPIINKENTYERFLVANKWISNYWPNSVANNMKHVEREKQIRSPFYLLHATVERLAYYLQRIYMSGKITREVIAPTRAFFHPVDWSGRVKRELLRRGVVYD